MENGSGDELTLCICNQNTPPKSVCVCACVVYNNSNRITKSFMAEVTLSQKCCVVTPNETSGTVLFARI